MTTQMTNCYSIGIDAATTKIAGFPVYGIAGSPIVAIAHSKRRSRHHDIIDMSTHRPIATVGSLSDAFAFLIAEAEERGVPFNATI